MSADSLGGKRGKAGIDLGRKYMAVVVLRNQIECFVRVSFQGPRGQSVDIDIVSGHVPIDFVSRGKVSHPCFRPALESECFLFARVGSGTGRQWLKYVEGAPVAQGPSDKRQERDQR